MPAEHSFPRAHAVVVPWPGQGHINPLMHLSRKLATDHGFAITFVNNEFTHDRVMRSILRQQEEMQEAEPAKLDIKFVSIPDGVSHEHTRTSNVPELSRGVLRSSAAFEQLLERLQPPVTCIISDTFVLHTQDAANKFGIPRVSFWTQSAASYAAHLAASRGFRLQSGCTVNEKVITSIAGAPPLRMIDMPGFLQCCDPSDFMFDFVTRPFLRTHEAACVVINTFDEWEGHAVDAIREQQPDCTFHTSGPLLPHEYFSGPQLSQRSINKTPALWPENYDCLKWLERHPPASVLYVSFGSITELSGEEMQEFALGLEASGLPLLWVLRPGLLEGGHSAPLPAGFEERTKDRILIISWAPQLYVLSHPSVGAFLTHAGWNSTLEGVSHGQPMLGFPYFADQMLNCRCIADLWGNGLAFERHGEGVLTRSEVERKARAVMGDSKLRERALHLRDAARRSVGEKGSSSVNFKLVVEATFQVPTR